MHDRFQPESRVARRQGAAPWAAGRPFDLSDHHLSPERAKLTIYKGPELKPEQMGMGRGWANVTRSGEEVTELLGLAGELAPGSSGQERLALAAAAV